METGAFIAKYWGKPGGAERATYQMFLTELAQMLGASTPAPGEGGVLGDYQFEGPVKSEAALGKKGTGRIDLYKRDCFILEAKQSQLKEGETLPADPVPEPLEEVKDLFGTVIGHVDPSGKRPPRYDRLMAEARLQAERYSLALPSGHKPPPFLIVADIGRAFELYFDWTGDGRGYGFFPNREQYRILLTDLEDAETRALLLGIWTDPDSVDPRKRAVEVTGDIAKRLSRVAAQLEETERKLNPGKAEFEVSLGIEATSLFLMRVLFCMFAEDVELLPKGSFTSFLDESRRKTDRWWVSGLTDLWQAMNRAEDHNRFWTHGDALVRYFNGNLFGAARVYDLPQEFRGELYEAARHEWRNVEPAIFGTLLEQVLTPSERAKLGAHYTPRPYVQRLVNATIGDVLRPEWNAVRETILGPSPSGEGEGVGHVDQPIAPVERGDSPHPNPSPKGEGLAAIRAFHARLCSTTVLDPACGTGNFLYVAMELLQQLEGEAIQLAAELGEVIAPTIHPNQFKGLELNPRAAVIAELVLWIGWLRHRLANHPDSIGEPVLPTLTNINFGTHGGYDAVLRRTATGEPDVETPMLPDWPDADFIVGNPPFIGAKYLRDNLGDAYVEALWKANPRVPQSADFVMHWWDRAAHILMADGSGLQRFGFVTTNSITQTFSRRVIEGYLQKPSPLQGGGLGGGTVQQSKVADVPPDTPHPNPSPEGEGLTSLSLLLAIPDHPWTKATKDAAAVRIAMTVAGRGADEGTLIEITGEAALETDKPVLTERARSGRINADLSLGADVISATSLKSNEGLGSRGVQLIGSGFIVTPSQAKHLGLGKREGLELHVREYRNGRDFSQTPRGVLVIDLFGLEERDVRQRFPEVYQHVLSAVKPERDDNRRESYKRNWWIHGEPRKDMRPALEGLPRFIATPATSKHRMFAFVDGHVLPDDALISFGLEDAFHLGVLSSSAHLEWTYVNCGLIGVASFEKGHRYLNSRVFDPFPFPDATPDQRAAIAELAEELDSTRKAALGETPGLTMTELYNLRAALRSGAEMSAEDRDCAQAARAGIVDRLHDQIDAAVADAYGWPSGLAPSEIVARLVALNAERAGEEAAGKVRWLRPDYQEPRFGKMG